MITARGRMEWCYHGHRVIIAILFMCVCMCVQGREGRREGERYLIAFTLLFIIFCLKYMIKLINN